MCRWFAYISQTEPCLLDDILVTPKHSLANQVHEHYLPRLLPHDHSISEEHDAKARNMLFNIDGLGVVWYTSSNADFEQGNTGKGTDGLKKTGLRPAMYKTVQPPMNDMNFRSICANTETRVCFAHIRAASGTAITPVNNHPFVFGRHAFMHNGAVSDFLPIRRAISDELSDAVFANIFGSTDSEHVAGLYMTYLTEGGDKSSFEQSYPAVKMAEAMHRAVATVLELQRTIVGDAERTPNSLNLCATDGIKLVAYRFRNHKSSQPPTLYWSSRAGRTLNRKYPDRPDGIEIKGVTDVGRDVNQHGKHLIVASEPSTYKEEDWALIGKNQFLLLDPENGPDVENWFKIEDAPYDAAWDAEDHDFKIQFD